MPDGYYRSPTIHDETVVFTCEDDLWTVPSMGGIARRLTSGLGAASSPLLSPDGTQIAFVGREEGESEIYVMPASGGAVKRLTFLGSSVISVAAWNRSGEIVFSSNAGQPFFRVVRMFRQRVTGGAPHLFWAGGRNRHRPRWLRTGTLEALPRRTRRAILDRSRRQWRLSSAAESARQPGFTPLDWCAHLFHFRP